MVWLTFLASAAVLVVTAIQLARFSDVIAVRTGLGAMFIGTLLMAGSTSLPELLSAVNALRVGAPNLAAGSMFGSSMFNMFALGVLDLLNQNTRILRQVAQNHTMTASIGNMMLGLAVFFILANINGALGWVGVDSLAIILVYVIGIRVIQGHAPAPKTGADVVVPEGVPSLRTALIGFLIATGVLLIITPPLVNSVSTIGEITGLASASLALLSWRSPPPCRSYPPPWPP